MKRLFLLLAAAAGAAAWWSRRSGASQESFGTTGSSPTPASPGSGAEPLPALGGDVDPDLLSILACPEDKAPVTRHGHFLVCSTCQRHYPIREGIPVMVVNEALTPEQAKAHVV